MEVKNMITKAFEPKQTKAKVCNYCGASLQIVWVHGHGQCNNCKVNIDECCRGESCEKTEQESQINTNH